MVALNSLQRKAWEVSEKSNLEQKTEVQALSLAKECIINKLELPTKAAVIDEAIKFVERSKVKLEEKTENIKQLLTWYFEQGFFVKSF